MSAILNLLLLPLPRTPAPLISRETFSLLLEIWLIALILLLLLDKSPIDTAADAANADMIIRTANTMLKMTIGFLERVDNIFWCSFFVSTKSVINIICRLFCPCIIHQQWNIRLTITFIAIYKIYMYYMNNGFLALNLIISWNQKYCRGACK